MGGAQHLLGALAETGAWELQPVCVDAAAYAAQMRRGFAFAALAASVALLGCGSTSEPRSASGKALFAEDCSACHSLIGNESLRRQGGDLRGYPFSRRDLLEFAREMPVRRPLDPVQLAAIVDYVSDKERSAGGH
jgi:mono/diheme cytochrome c family protein